MAGIEKLKEAVLQAVDLAIEIRLGLEDGKLGFGEMLGLIDNANGLAAIALQWKQILEEIKDLDLLERAELNKYVTEQLSWKKTKQLKGGSLALGVFIAETLDLILAIVNYTIKTTQMFRK